MQSMPTLAFAFVLAVALFVLARSWIWRLEEGAGPSSFRAFVACGLLYAGLYGCALGWVMEQSMLLGVFATFFSFPLVFGGVRQIAGYFGFDPVYYTASGGALAALGLFFSLVVFSGPLTQVGLLSRSDDADGAVLGVVLRGLLLPLFFVGAFVVLARIGRHHDEVAEKSARRQPDSE